MNTSTRTFAPRTSRFPIPTDAQLEASAARLRAADAIRAADTTYRNDLMSGAQSFYKANPDLSPE